MKYIIAILSFCSILSGLSAQTNETDSLLQLLSVAREDSGKVRLLNNLSEAYISIQTDSSLQFVQKAISLAQRLRLTSFYAALYAQCGKIHMERGEDFQALENIHKAYALDLNAKDSFGIMRDLFVYGRISQQQNDNGTAMDYYLKTLNLADRLGKENYLFAGNINIGQLYMDQNNWSRAEYYYKRCFDLSQKSGNKEQIAKTNGLMGDMALIKGDTPAAEKYYNTSLGMKLALNDKTGAAIELVALGGIYENDNDKKLSYFLKAKELYDNANPNDVNAVINMGNIGIAYSEFVQYNLDTLSGHTLLKNIGTRNKEVLESLAEKYLNDAIDACRKCGYKDVESAFLQALSEEQSYKGNYKESLYNLKKANELRDSINSQENKNKIAELDAKYKFQSKEAVYKEQQRLSAFHIKQLWAYAILILIMATAVFIWLLNRYRIKQLNLQNELQRSEAQEKEKELSLQNMLTQSELKAIRAQMNPHFIFNVLNSIESYILEQDATTAGRLLQKFATLCRLILENSTEQTVAFEREWQALILYTELEAIRFGNSFRYSFHRDENVESSIFISPMMVQPLVENAILHGIRNSGKNNLRLDISVHKQDDTLIFSIQDNGTGPGNIKEKDSFITSKSFGITTIKDRINIINQSLGKSIASFSLMRKDDITVATIVLPVFY